MTAIRRTDHSHATPGVATDRVLAPQKASRDDACVPRPTLPDRGHPQGADAQPSRPRFAREVEQRLHQAGVHVPLNFTIDVLLFIRDAMHASPQRRSPQILGVDGPPGVGKSFSLRAVLRAARVEVEEIEPVMLENPSAGLPAQYVTTQLTRAAQILAEGRVAVVVIDDTELTLHEHDERSSGTTNTEQVVSALQSYADDPTQIAGRPHPPVPIITLTNEPDRLRESLRRAGRREQIVFDPRGQDLKKMALACLRGRLTKGQVHLLFHQTKGWRISEYRELASQIDRFRRLEGSTQFSIDELWKSAASEITPQPVPESRLRACIAAVHAGLESRSYLDKRNPDHPETPKDER